jgi:hypothetical protein
MLICAVIDTFSAWKLCIGTKALKTHMSVILLISGGEHCHFKYQKGILFISFSHQKLLPF